jgi:predicted nucleic acid-binding protein
MSVGDAFFVDSNVLLYSVDPVEPAKRTRATEWLDGLWVAGAGRLSWQVLHEFYWNAVRKMRLEPGAARGMVEDMCLWRPVDTSLGLVQQAWHWTDRAHVSYWDALILAAAQRSGAKYLLTEDFQDQRQYEDVEVLNPFEHSPAEFALNTGQ